MNDLNGRPWATVANTQSGHQVETDAGFTCIDKGAILTVLNDEQGLYIPCSSGKHYLDGQLSNDLTHYVGLYRV